MILETKRLILREMTHDDYAALYSVLADSDIMRHYPYTFDEARVKGWIMRNIERYRVFGFGLWAVTLADSGKFIGDCGLTMQNINGFIRPEIGYHIGREHQRCGYAHEAAKRSLKLAFEKTPFNIIYAYMKKSNIASAATAMSIGMKLTEEYIDTENETTSVYSVSRDKN